MSSIPVEFDPEYIESRSSPEARMYHAEVSSNEPMKSVLEPSWPASWPLRALCSITNPKASTQTAAS